MLRYCRLWDIKCKKKKNKVLPGHNGCVFERMVAVENR